MPEDSGEQDIEELDEAILGIGREEAETFQVCPDCGSIELTTPPTKKDVLSAAWGGTLDGRVYCRSCGYEGLPILFDRHSMNEYERFRDFRQEKLKEGETRVSESPAVDSFYEGLKPGLSALLSFFIPGFGQLYNHKPMKAILFVSVLVFILGFGLAYRQYSYILTLIPLVYLISIIDAHRDARGLGV